MQKNGVKMRKKIKNMNRLFENRVLLQRMVFIFICIAACILRYPDFDTALWKASDTNYQCLMNVKAMSEADAEAHKWLPLITFSDETDYGLEYSSGGFDMATGKYFYYVSFPMFTFDVLFLFFLITGLPINIQFLYAFCSILFCISLVLIMKLFGLLFNRSMKHINVEGFVGIFYIFSTEIMQSMGLTYWGQNWYMIFFPAMCIAFVNWLENKKRRDAVIFMIMSFFILQTEWTGYFAVAAFGIVCLYSYRKSKEKKYFWLMAGVGIEVVAALLVYIVPNISVVGIKQFIAIMTERFVGRTRTSDYSVLTFLEALMSSFGVLLIILAILIVWAVIARVDIKGNLKKQKYLKLAFIVMVFPLAENIIFMNHALEYSMDRMKWFYVFIVLALILADSLADVRASRIIISYIAVIAAVLNLGCYRLLDNEYIWKDERLKASKELQACIEWNYSDNVLGQLGTNSVWGYSKLLFHQGIEGNTSINLLKDEAVRLNKRYAVALNDLDLCYTQKWYSSAIIYDNQKNEYNIVGSLANQYDEKMNDLYYLKYADYIYVFVNSFGNLDNRVDFDAGMNVQQKIEKIYKIAGQYNLSEDILYYMTTVAEVPELITVDMQDTGEWRNGISEDRNCLIFKNTAGNRDALLDAKKINCVQKEAVVSKCYVKEDFIYMELEQNPNIDINDFAFPNPVEIVSE